MKSGTSVRELILMVASDEKAAIAIDRFSCLFRKVFFSPDVVLVVDSA